jgi:nucleotide-binding universal stress UspA family protein
MRVLDILMSLTFPSGIIINFQNNMSVRNVFLRHHGRNIMENAIDTTKSYSIILIPVDGSEPSRNAAHYGISLAVRYNAKLVVLNVDNLNSIKKTFSSFITAPTYGTEEMKQKKEAMQNFLDEILKIAEESSVEVKTQIIEESESVIQAILEYAENEMADLIIVGTRGNSKFKKLLLGSTTEGVVTYAHCPVLVVK